MSGKRPKNNQQNKPAAGADRAASAAKASSAGGDKPAPAGHRAQQPSATTTGRAPGANLLIPFDNWHTVIILSLVSAGIMALAFPPLRWSWLAHLALAPMLLAIVRAPGRWSLLLGPGLAGAVFFGGEMYWMPMATLPGYIGTVIFCLIFWVLFALLLRWTSRRTLLPLTLLAPVIWVAMEVGRTYALTGFPWFLLGHAQARTLTLLQSADLAGVYGLSALSAASAGLLVDLITRPVFLRYGKHIRLARSLKISAALLLAFWLLVVGYGIYRLQPVEMLPGPKVVTVQSNVPQEVMPVTAEETPTDDEAGKEGAKSGLKQAYNQLMEETKEALAAHPEADLVVWPEAMAPGILNWESLWPSWERKDLPEDFVRWRDYWTEIHSLIADRRTDLLVGSQTLAWKKIKDGYDVAGRYNSAILFRPDDQPYVSTMRYDKMHLVPFGEVVPFRESAPWLYKMLMSFTPYKIDYSLNWGERVVRMETAGARFGVPICFESSIARLCRQMVYENGSKKADFLANISNDGWFHGTIELEQHWDQSVFRAVENRVPVVRSVNTGISGFIDSSGRTVNRVEYMGQVRSLTGYSHWQLEIDPRTSFYGRHGDVFGFALCALAALLVVLGLVRPRSSFSADT